MMYGLPPHTIQLILTEISNYPEICDLVIYGSRAKGTHKKGSDIDLAAKGENITFGLITKLKTRFNQVMTIPYHIDLIHYESIANKDLLDHIDRVGKSLFQNNS